MIKTNSKFDHAIMEAFAASNNEEIERYLTFGFSIAQSITLVASNAESRAKWQIFINQSQSQKVEIAESTEKLIQSISMTNTVVCGRSDYLTGFADRFGLPFKFVLEKSINNNSERSLQLPHE